DDDGSRLELLAVAQPHAPTAVRGRRRLDRRALAHGQPEHLRVLLEVAHQVVARGEQRRAARERAARQLGEVLSRVQAQRVVAVAPALARAPSLQHHVRDAAARQLARCRQPCRPAADHDGIHVHGEKEGGVRAERRQGGAGGKLESGAARGAAGGPVAPPIRRPAPPCPPAPPALACRHPGPPSPAGRTARSGERIMPRRHTRFVPVFALGLAVLAAAEPVLAQQQGQRRRPGEGRQPEFPPPTILEHKPRSTLVGPAHEVPRAKFPVVDFHGHPPLLVSRDVIESVVAAMDSLNIQVMVQARGTSGEQLTRQIQAVRDAGYEDRFVFFTTLDLREVGPGSGEKIAAQLEADVRAGAVGVGEINKAFGLSYHKTDGTRLKLDDPELDPVWETAARLNIPVFIHVGDPAEFFQPLDFENERWLEMALFANRRFNDRSRYPSFDELMEERDRLLARHPNTTWVLAHLGWHAQDLARLGRIFDAMPHVYAEIGAVLYDLGRQPRTAHRFFVKYQDRLLFGKDSFQPDEYPYY